jgi:hypothetical protein
VQPVAVLRSCFRECVGTPRQGFLAPKALGKIVFQKNISPEALSDLSSFSHVWITFVFHLNSNFDQNILTHDTINPDNKSKKGGRTFPAKVLQILKLCKILKLNRIPAIDFPSSTEEKGRCVLDADSSQVLNLYAYDSSPSRTPA